MFSRAPHLQRGERAERTALAYLKRRGLRHLASNYRCRLGEIDLVMQDGESLVFVEVRFRQGAEFGGGPASVDHRKQHKLRITAEHYRQSQAGADRRPCRFDVVAISGALDSNPSIDWIQDAF